MSAHFINAHPPMDGWAFLLHWTPALVAMGVLALYGYYLQWKARDIEGGGGEG